MKTFYSVEDDWQYSLLLIEKFFLDISQRDATFVLIEALQLFMGELLIDFSCSNPADEGGER